MRSDFFTLIIIGKGSMIGGVLLFSTLPFFSLGVPIKGQLKEAMALAYKEYNEAIMPTLSMERRTEYDIGPFLRWWSSYSLTLYESESEIILSLTLYESESEIIFSCVTFKPFSGWIRS